MLRPEQVRILKGALYRLVAKVAREPRTSEDWSISFLLYVHKELFKNVVAEHAGKLRQTEVTFRNHAVATPGQIPYRLSDLVKDAQDIIAQAHSIVDEEERIEAIFPRIARFHADCIVVQPFIDGNKRWARLVLSALLVDCRFWPGTRIEASEQVRYMEAIDKAVAGDPEQLADLILEGWLCLEQDFSSGSY